MFPHSGKMQRQSCLHFHNHHNDCRQDDDDDDDDNDDDDDDDDDGDISHGEMSDRPSTESSVLSH